MDKLKQFLKWGLLSVILQCLVLFVFDKFYFKLNSDVNVKAIDIASQHTKENNDVKLPGNMMDKKISYDGEYIAYLNNNDELKVFNTLKDDESHVDIENEKASYYTWLRDRNRLIVITNIKYNNKKNTVNLYSIDVDTNKTKKIELGNMNSSYKVNEITVSTKTGVIYIEFKNEDTEESIVNDKKVEWTGEVAEVKVGFSIRDGGLASIFLMYGTPTIEPDMELYNSIYGSQTKSKVRKKQKEVFEKGILRG